MVKFAAALPRNNEIGDNPARAFRPARLRHGQIETLRGLACLLVVAFHVIGYSDGGMRVSDTSAWRMFTLLLAPIRMPLFAFISGYVFFAATSNSTGELLAALHKRIIRLGIPLISITLIYDLVYFAVGSPHASVSLVTLFVLPYQHFWYLQASLLVSGFVTLIFILAGHNKQAASFALFPFTLVLAWFMPQLSSPVFSLNGALYLLPFFALGLMMRICKPVAELKPFAIAPARAGLLVLMVVLLLWPMFEDKGLEQVVTQDFDVVARSCLLCLGFYLLQLRLPLLEQIGPYSFTIYLFHPLFNGFMRGALHHAAPHAGDVLVFTAGLAAGIIGPIILHEMLSRSRVGAFLILGVQPRRS